MITVAPKRIRIWMISVAFGLLLLGLSGCLHDTDKPEPPGVQLLGVLTAPTEVPGDLAWDGEALWVTDIAGEQLYRVSPSDGRILQQLRLPGLGVLAQGVAWDGEALWVAMPLDEQLYRLDPRDGRVLSQLPLSGTDVRALIWDGATLWVVDGAQLVQVDVANGQPLQTISLPPGADPAGLAWDGQQFWWIDRNRALLLTLSPTGGDPAPGGPWSLSAPITAPAGLAWDGQSFWLSDEASGALFRLTPGIGSSRTE